MSDGATKSTSGMAIASLVTGICGVLCILPCIGGLLGVIFGHVSLGQIKRSGGSMGGRGMAIGGLVTGYLGIVLSVLVVPALFLPVLSKAREKARRVNCAGNLKQIGLALMMYAVDNDGTLPTTANGGVDFGTVADAGYITPSGKVWACPSAWQQGLSVHNSNYTYVGSGLKVSNPNAPNVVIAYEASGNHPGNSWMNALFIDGHVEGARPDGSKGWNKN